MEEIWKDIPGYEGVYQISSKGRVRSLRKKKVITYEDILVNVDTYDVKGYKYVYLYKKGLKRSFSMKKLLEECFGNYAE